MPDVRAGQPARSPAAVAAFGLVLVSLIGFLPSSGRPALTVLIAAALVGAACGLPLLVRLVVSGDRVAWLAAGFVVWACVAAVASSAPLAWTGEYFTGTGAVFCAAMAAYWAIGRWLPENALPAIASGFVAGAGVNAVVAVLQGVVDLSSADIYLYDERSTGLLGNPVFMGATCAAAVPLLGLITRRTVVAAGAVVVLSAATQMSGSRVGIAALVAAGVWTATRFGRRGGATIVVALLLGLGAGAALQGNADTTAAARVSASGGLAPRVANWRAGLAAAADHPLVGAGPGRWRAATSSRRTPALAREVGADRLYADAHNPLVEYVGTTGFVGGALVIAWLATAGVTALRGRRPELAWAAGALGAYHLVEPQHLTLTPLMLLLAGAAVPRRAPVTPSPAARVATALLVIVAVVLGGRVVLGDITYRSAELDFAGDRMERAADLLWPWPNPVNARARIHAFVARTEKDDAELIRALAEARRARRLEPDNPIQSVNVASFLGQLDQHEEAAREYQRALRANPWSRLALTGLAAELRALDRSRQAAACRRAADLNDHTDEELRAAQRTCVAADAKRERP